MNGCRRFGVPGLAALPLICAILLSSMVELNKVRGLECCFRPSTIISRSMGAMNTPSFRNPPVIETVLGVQFSPIPDWSIPHFGVFWDRVREEFPNTQILHPLPPLTAEMISGAVKIQVVEAPEVRCWYKGIDESELIQIQQDRFIVNWRQAAGALAYPRYPHMRSLFQTQWARFKQFLSDESLTNPIVIQCEITYVNHIPKGEGWETAQDWERVFTVCGEVGGGDKFLPPPEGRQFTFNYPMPNARGTLDVTAVRAVRKIDGKDVIQFRLSARGRPTQHGDDGIMEWFDLGRDWVVRGFTELTTPSMHEMWGME